MAGTALRLLVVEAVPAARRALCNLAEADGLQADEAGDVAALAAGAARAHIIDAREEFVRQTLIAALGVHVSAMSQSSVQAPNRNRRVKRNRLRGTDAEYHRAVAKLTSALLDGGTGGVTWSSTLGHHTRRVHPLTGSLPKTRSFAGKVPRSVRSDTVAPRSTDVPPAT